MATVILQRAKGARDSEISNKVLTFLGKLQEDHTRSGVHIEPLNHCVDPTVRTGRVDKFWRAVLFEVYGGSNPTYVYVGTFPHDDAIAFARRSSLRINPVNGVAELRFAEVPIDAADRSSRVPAGTPGADTPPVSDRATAAAAGDRRERATGHEPSAPAHEGPSLLAAFGLDRIALVDELGLDADLADRALAARTEDTLLEIAGSSVAAWQGLVLVELAAGVGLSDVREKFGLDQPAPEGEDRMLRALAHPAARLEFAWIEDEAEMRAIIEAKDADAWRVYLHPAQRNWVERSYNGPLRVSGGAGTGKTVVVVHRARSLARKIPSSRILVTTYTTNLADALTGSLRTLDSRVTFASQLGEPGIRVSGIDATARAVLRAAHGSVAAAAETVLGTGRDEVTGVTPAGAWKSAIDAVGPDLPEALLTPVFFADEYELVVLPGRITTEAAYLRARRPGRGFALDRTKRSQVWAVIEAYRAAARANGSIDFAEAAAIAAAWLDEHGPMVDHVLVDEGQDLRPTHWQMLRALVGEHRDDMFIAEDSHQRIYGPSITLGRLGIKIVGRSKRLTLNYRTTAENLRWAMSVLDGGDYHDLNGEDEKHREYRSARQGPEPLLLPASSIVDELDQSADLLRRWLDEGVTPEQIGILVRDRFQRERVVGGLGERGVKVRSVDREAIKPGQPVVLTMHRAKGTEFERILLFGVQEGSIPAAMREAQYDEVAKADALLRERSLLYVAGSRARDVLAITWAGDRSPLLPGRLTR